MSRSVPAPHQGECQDQPIDAQICLVTTQTVCVLFLSEDPAVEAPESNISTISSQTKPSCNVRAASDISA